MAPSSCVKSPQASRGALLISFNHSLLQRDERVLIVWSESLDNIIPTCHDFEERLIKLLWRSKPPMGESTVSASSHSISGSVSGHSQSGINSGANSTQPTRRQTLCLSAIASASQTSLGDPEKGIDEGETKTKKTRTWYGRKKTAVIDTSLPEERPARYFAPLYSGVAAGLSFGAHLDRSHSDPYTLANYVRSVHRQRC